VTAPSPGFLSDAGYGRWTAGHSPCLLSATPPLVGAATGRTYRHLGIFMPDRSVAGSDAPASPLPPLDVWAAWVFDTCRLFGASLSTAHKVAGEFVAGLERDRG